MEEVWSTIHDWVQALQAQDLENGDEHRPLKSYSSAILTLGLIYLT